MRPPLPAEGTPVKQRGTPSSQRGLFPATAFDIASAEDFPSLVVGEIPRSGRGGNKHKRRIRPTTLSNSDKPIEGDITALGTGAAPALGKMDDGGAGRVKVHAQQAGRLQEALEEPRSMAWTREETKVITSKKLPLKMKRGKNSVEDVGHVEKGNYVNGLMHLRDTASGSFPLEARARQGPLDQLGEGTGAQEITACHGSALSEDSFTSLRFPAASRVGKAGVTVRTPVAAADSSSIQQRTHPGSRNVDFLPAASLADDEPTPCTPTKPYAPVSPSRSIDGTSTWSDGVIPMSPTMTTTEQKCRWKEVPALAILASLYIHIMVRRLAPSLATEMHLTVRLLHAPPSVARTSRPRGSVSEYHHGLSPRRNMAPTQSVVDINLPQGASQGDNRQEGDHRANCLFRTGLDCRSFAARVLVGLNSLLPHIGADTLDLLAGSLALASESEERINEARQVLLHARSKNIKAGGNGGRGLGQHNADDTAIVQNVGAPFAALQWREQDSVNHCRTTTDRALFQNRQKSVDLFGSLLRDYQGSKKGLQHYPERALQDLRAAASALISDLAPENLGWLAQYFLAQLVGWGLAPPEETDSEVMALVAPAGDKGRATLQKLHRRISTPSSGEDGNALKSSQKLRHPGTQPRQVHGDQDRSSHDLGGVCGAQTSTQQARSSRSGTGPRHSKRQTPVTGLRVPTAPLQLRWFPGNQEFFYHVLLALDSHIFNTHLKTELVREIARLYRQQSTRQPRSTDAGRNDGDSGGASDGGSATVGEGVTGFTSTMVKLKVLAKFLGVLTFAPNWGIPASDVPSTLPEDPISHIGGTGYSAYCPLPLFEYLDHAWSTEGLIGAVPWLADFLRMMKWDELSAQAVFYKNILTKLAVLHFQPCMRPGHRAFTESLLAVSCDVETLFQDLGCDLGVHGYRSSSLSGTPAACLSLCGESDAVRAHHTGFESSPSFGERSSTPTPGTLDAEVVLSRRLIQNCCPYLEDVLTLIGSLKRAWALGLTHVGDGSQGRVNRSPRLVGATGVSPRSRRVIKPHPLRPLPTLPSVPEQNRRSDDVDRESETGKLSAHTESARLRLVEAFFHSLPDELQTTADFVVRRAVHNACEEILSVVVRPAVAAAFSRNSGLQGWSMHRELSANPLPARRSLAQSTFSVRDRVGDTRPSRQHGNMPTTHLEKRMVMTAAELEQSVGSKARLFAGRKSYSMAQTATLSLVPQSLPLRVREIAAAIAGFHAQQASEKRIEEITKATVSEAAAAYHVEKERQRLDVANSSIEQSHQQQENVGMVAGREVDLLCLPVRGTLPISTALELPAHVSALLDVAQELELESGETHTLIEAAQQVASSNGADVDAAARIVRETLRLVRSIRWRQESVCATDTGDIRDTATHSREQSKSRSSNGLGDFLALIGEVWGSLYGATDVCKRQVVRALQHGFSTTAIDAIKHLVHLAAMAWECTIVSDAGLETTASEDGSSERSQCRPWVPILQLMAWGVVPAATAENAVLSCLGVFRSTSKPRKGATSNNQGKTTEPRRDALIAIASAVAKGYHRLGAEEVARSIPPQSVGTKLSGWYHSMNLCRLVARLEML